jgi:hypothetical protein
VVRYYSGEEVWTHLKREAQGSGFVTTWWNAKGEPVQPPDTIELPTRPGEVVRAAFRGSRSSTSAQCSSSGSAACSDRNDCPK